MPHGIITPPAIDTQRPRRRIAGGERFLGVLSHDIVNGELIGKCTVAFSRAY